MSGQEIEASIRLSHADFIMQNHRVHGVSVLPGVTFLDIVYRVLAARGADVSGLALANVLFSEPVTTTEGYERELRITVSGDSGSGSGSGSAPGDGTRRFRVDSRWVRDGVECAPWRENARGEVVADDEPHPAALDVAGWLAGVRRREDMETLYDRTRGEQIVHGVPMKCFGTLHFADGPLLAELSLDASAGTQAGRFHLHPGEMDASTLVAFGQRTDVGAEGFIPFFIEYFRAPRALTERFHVLVPRPEEPSESGELLRNDYQLFDETGGFLAEFRGIACKRIRHPELITKLLAEVGGAGSAGADTAADGVPPIAVAGGDGVAGDDPVAAVTGYLKTRIGGLLDRDPAAVPVDAGFYDLGLDSVALLRMSEELEEIAGTTLYPTLLFEFGDIASLARHLAATYPVRVAVAAGQHASDAPTDEAPQNAEDVALCFADVWVPAPAPAGAPRELLTFGAPGQVVQDLRDHGCSVVTVEPADLPDPGARDQLAALLERHAATTFAWFTDDPLAVWALAAALVDRRARSADVIVVSQNPALAALAATVSAEVPALRCRVTDSAADLLTDSAEPDVRYLGGVRHVRRWRPVEPGLPARPVFRDQGVYLVTGAAGGIAGQVADHLARRHRARLVLVGRSECPAGLRDRMDEWSRLGAEARYIQADVTRVAEVRAAVAEARAEFGDVNGVLHCAGTVADGLFFRAAPAELAAVWAAKTAGTVALDDATADCDLDMFVLFSSLSAVVANPGQAGYAFGNAFQYEFARTRSQRTDRPGRSLAVAWPLWAEGGMRVPAEAARRSRETTGMAALPTGVAVEILERGLAGDHDRFAVVHGDGARISGLLPAIEADVAQEQAARAAGLPEATAGPAPSSAATPMPIAVIGLAGRYPGAATLDEFWRNLAAGRDSVTEIPLDRWDHGAYYDPDQDAPGRTYAKWGGFLDGVDRFEPGFFGISRRDAERMDPQERLFLTTGWQAFEDAGYVPRTLAEQGAESVGVFVGVMWNHYQLYADGVGDVAPTAMHASIANRVSYSLNLRGPSMAVDTACSSSLTAVHLAVESIRRGESTMALAGGVNVSIHPQKYLQLAEGRFLSTDGRCRSFGAGGDGYVPGEGVGAVLLKPLERALADGDHVYGVIAATALNHTGRTSGFTVPSPVAQGELVAGVLGAAGWGPGDLDYVEAHGTGTALGDPIEVEGLRQAFGAADVPAGSVALGSVKSNIGHLESAAGIAGLTKVLLQLRHGELAPSLHSAATNPHIDFARSAFRVPQVREPWVAAPGRPRRAGVSAFGAGGANAHVLVAEAPAPPARETSQGSPVLVVLSARNDEALRAYVAKYLDFLGEAGVAPVSGGADVVAREAAAILGIPVSAIGRGETFEDLGFDAAGLRELGERLGGGGVPRLADTVAELAGPVVGLDAVPDLADLADLAYTLQVGRTQLASRFAAVVSDPAELRQALRAHLAAGSSSVPVAEAPLTPAACAAAFRAGRLTDVAASWLAGVDIDWAACHAGVRSLRRVPLPTYPFQEEPCWIGRWKGTMRPSDRPGPQTAGAPAPTPRRAAPLPSADVFADVFTEPFANSEALELRVLEPGIALLTMRDPSGTNMFTDLMTRGLQQAFADIARRDDVKAVVVTGSADVFSMGATPDALEVLASGGSRFTDVPFMYEGMLRCDRPVVAAIQGHASGGGLAFGLFADVVVMAREGVYSANFMKYGFTPGMGATYILEQRFGRSVATEMFYTGRPFTGEELERRGAGVAFAARGDVLATALAAARSIAEKPAAAVRVLKADLADRALRELPAVIAREAAMHEEVFGADSVERIREHFGKVEGYRAGGAEAAAPAPAGSLATTQASTAPPPAMPAPTSQATPIAQATPISQAMQTAPPIAPDQALVTLKPTTPRATAPVPIAPTVPTVPSAPPHPATPTESAASAPAPAPAEPPRTTAPALDPAAITEVITTVLCNTLYLAPNEIDSALAFSEMGLDSIGTVELVRELNRAFTLDIDSVAVYDHPTIPQLVRYVGDVAARNRDLVAQAVQPAAPAPQPMATPEPTVAPAPVAEPAPAPTVVLAPAAPTVAAAVPSAPTSSGTVTLRPLTKRPRTPAATVPATSPTPRRTVTERVPERAPEPAPVATSDIAIIGMSGRFPDAPDLPAFWTNLLAGHDSIREVPATRWGTPADSGLWFDPDRKAVGRSYSKWGAMLADVDAFDAAFFRISPLEAAAMDPQQRLFLQTAWAGIEDAGYATPPGAGATGGRRWGVFVGCAAGDYAELLREADENDSAHAFLGSATSVLAARIAYHLDLTGPTMAVDTACSSSLVAVHLACQAIRAGECEAAVAGGVALMVTPRMHVLTSKTGMLSPTGRSAPFDASADGIVLGEACGAVVLKRLDRALADGDTVHGVILGSGVNGDGRTNGITAPSAASQAELIGSVLRGAGVAPGDLTYVETHGTGTPLGDPIEAKALTLALGDATAGLPDCAIGSAKSNIGHTTTAAGIVGLLKVLLALRHRTLPPTINYRTANPEIDFAAGRLRPVTAATPWTPGASGRLVGAVSSFGFSGTNAHVLVAEPPRRPDSDGAGEGPTAVLLSAPNERALDLVKRGLADRLRDGAERPALADVAYTLAVGRSHFGVRDARVVADLDELVRWLDGVVDGVADGAAHEDSEAARRVADYLAGREVDGEQWRRGGARRRVSLPTYPFAPDRHWVAGAPQAAAARTVPTSGTAPTVPAPTVPAPTGTAIPAQTTAGPQAAYSTDAAPAGSAGVPAAAPLPPGHLARPIHASDWLVTDHRVAGTPLLPGVAVLELAADAAGRDLRVAPLRVAGVQWLRPFTVADDRTAHVAPTARGFELTDPIGAVCSRGRVEDLPLDTPAEPLDLDAVSWRCPERRTAADVYRAFTAAGIDYGPSFQVLHEVRFGPDEALAVLRMPAPRAGETATRAMHPVLLDGALQTIAVLAGAAGSRPQVPFALAAADFLAPLPESGYSHVTRDGSTFTVRVLDDAGRVCVRFTGLALRAIPVETAKESESSVERMLFVPRLRAAAPAPIAGAAPQRVTVIQSPGSSDLAEALATAHRAHGADVTIVPWNHDVAADPDVVYFLADALTPAASDHGRAAVRALLYTAQQLIAAGHTRRAVTVKAVIDGRPAAAGIPGLLGAIAAEYPRWTLGAVDVGDIPQPAGRLAEHVLAEPCAERLVVLRDGHRLTRVLAPAGSAGAEVSAEATTAPGTPATPFRPQGTYLIVGGAGGIGGVLSRHLARTVNARIALIGRRPLTPETAALLADVERLGGRAAYFQADVADEPAFRRAVAAARSEFGALHGAYHAALVLRDASVANLDAARLAEAMAAKTAGAVVFGEVLRDEPLDHMVFFSSAVSFTDAGGQANYAAASTFEDCYALDLRDRCRFPVTVVNWGYWGSVGAVADDRYAKVFEALDVASIEPDEGMAALAELIRRRTPQALVVKAGPAGLARLGVAAGSGAGVWIADSRAGALPAPVAATRAAFADLELLAPALLREALPLPQRTTVQALRTDLAVTPATDRLFDAVLELLVRSGTVRRTGDSLDLLPGTPTAANPAALTTRHPFLEPYVELLTRCVTALPRILAGTVRATEILFPQGSAELVERVYRGQPASDYYHRLMAAEVSDALRQPRRSPGDPFRVLEIGAGTGAGSAFALEACAASGTAVEYTYTDISTAFLNRGEAAFAQRFPFLRFQTLDIERPPAGQGFADHGYDLVLATNVLHATSDMARTLAHTASLLRPGGRLVVNEATAASDFLTLTFGLTPGWWRFEDPAVRLPRTPLIGPAGWRGLLTAAGFGDVRISGFADTAPDDLEQCLLVGTVPVATTSTAPPVPVGTGGRPTAQTTRDYVRQVFAEVLRYQEQDLQDRVTFDNYGVDSLLSLDLVSRFEKDLGTLPSTLLFDHMTIEQLAGHFLAERSAELAALLAPEEPAAPPVPAALPTRASVTEASVTEATATETAHRPAGPGRSSAPDDAVAVIGLTGRYPGAPDVDAFWHLLAEGRTGVTEIPADRWDWRTHYDPDPAKPQRTTSRWGGFLDGVDRFDAAFFGILPREAANIDPQERLFLETAWNLLEEAGYLGEHTREPETGVFVGTMYGSYGQLGAAEWAHGQLSGAHSAYWSIANRASYFLDLHGPSFAVDSACSSSLLAVHLACESIRRGECRMAIAGGVNVILHPAHHVALSGFNMLSADGRCKVFDAGADGFVPGEGVGAVLLKPLHQAVADGDRIWGVIRGGQANAGGKTGGYTVPNPTAQTSLISAVLARTGVDPATIGYVEAHGTGTSLGDPIEVSALSRALGPGRGDGVRCALGSVKANVGHLEGAAGIAGLTRVLVQLRHGSVAPCVNLGAVNPKIDLDVERFVLPRELTPWPAAEGQPRRGAVSSFGAGGANVHLIVEEYREPAGAETEPDRPGEEHVFVLSARTRGQLAVYARQVGAFVGGTGARLADLCFTSQVGRRELAERLVVLADSRERLARRLLDFAAAEGAMPPEGVLVGTAGPAGPDAFAAERSESELGAMWVRGVPVDWRTVWAGRVVRRVGFPTYPFERKRYWLTTTGPTATPATMPALEPATESAARPATPFEAPVASPTPEPTMPSALPAPSAPSIPSEPATTCRFRRVAWTPAPSPEPVRRPQSVLLIAGTDAAELSQAFEAVGARPIVATPRAGRFAHDSGTGYAFDPGVDDHCERLVAALADRDLQPDSVVFVAGSGGSLDEGLYPLIRLSVSLLGRRTDAPLRVAFVSTGTDGSDPSAAAAAAALRTLAREHTRFSGVAIATDHAPGWASAVAAELAGEAADVRYRAGVRMLKDLAEFTPPAPAGAARPGGVYLITGGAGALGLHFAEHLSRSAPCTVILAGRSQPGPATAARIAALSQNGSSVIAHRADVTSAADIAALLAAHGPLTGVIHAAGRTDDGWARRKTRAGMAAVVAPKARGAELLDAATKESALDFFVLFSSVAGEAGNAGQVDYAAANAYLHAFAERREGLRRRGERSGRTVAIAWPLWEDGGMKVDAATRELFARSWGMVPMRTEVGIAAFERVLAGDETVVLVVEETGAKASAGSAAPAPQRVAVPASRATAAGTPTPERLREAAEAVLRSMAAGFLLVDEAEVALTDDLMDTGFDSITLTELVNKVNETYLLDLLPTVLFECADLASFAEYLVGHHADAVAATVPAEPDAVVVATPVESVTAASSPDSAPQGPAAPADDPVAIVGMAGVLPGAPDLDAFWRHLVAGADLTGPAPADRLELHAHPDTAGLRGGFVDGVADFDAPLFRVSPTEAALMDPQQRMFLQAVWRAVEDAGHRPAELAGTDTGLFVGVSTTDYADLLRLAGVAMEAHTASGIAHSILANRVSHVLDLRGPSEAVDTACSSSLVALHRAVAAIRAGECSAALVGGVNVLLSPGLFTAFTASGMLSPDGACKTFDAGADGYVRGEGVGALLLKPLSAARAAGDHVYAVVRGSAVNHGGRSTSLTAPNPEAQAQVLVRAYHAAGVDPATVTAIEAHGTGTRLGDPVEVEGLKKAFAQLYAERGVAAPATPHVALGSVKTNVGHLEAAAGMAGMLKVLLAMRYGVLPPTIHFQELNPYVRLEGTPFFVNEAARPWAGVADGRSGRLVRRAGVSSFGFGGTNAHVVLEAVADDAAPMPVVATGRDGTPRLLMVSAATDDLLAEHAESLARFLRERPETDLASVAYTLHAGRTELPSRLAVIAESAAQASRLLADAARGADAPALVFRGRAAKGAVEGAYRGESLGVVAAQWVAGAPVSPDRLWPDGTPRRIPLPATPLRRRAHWFDDRAERRKTVETMAEPAMTAAVGGAATPAAASPAAGQAATGPVASGPAATASAASSEIPAPIAPATTPPVAAASAAISPAPAEPAAQAPSVPSAAIPAVPAADSVPRRRTKVVLAPVPAVGGPAAGAEPASVGAAPSGAFASGITVAEPASIVAAPTGTPAADVIPAEPVAAPRPIAGDPTAAVRGHIADILGLVADEVDPDMPFADLGLDSIFRMDLARRLNTQFAVEMQAAELYEHDTAALLATHLQATAAASPAAATDSPTVPAAAPATQPGVSAPSPATAAAPVANAPAHLSAPAPATQPAATAGTAGEPAATISAPVSAPVPVAAPTASVPVVAVPTSAPVVAAPVVTAPAAAVPVGAVPAASDPVVGAPTASAPVVAAPAATTEPPFAVAQPPAAPLALLTSLIELITERPTPPETDFTSAGFTSFDMLRVVSALERRFGALRKTLLFDHTTPERLAGHLVATFGAARAADLLAASLADGAPADAAAPVQLGAVPPAAAANLGAATIPATSASSTARASASGPFVVRKRTLTTRPDAAALLTAIDDRHAKEGGLAGRDIAPLAFVGSARTAYFNFSRRGRDLFAWSYAGSEADFPVLAAEWLAYAERNGLRPNFLSMLPLTEAAGVALTATPFGAVQRLEDLAGFTSTGGKMTRLRYMLNRFEKTGACTTVEYQPGTDPETDLRIADMIGRWAERKQMVNPYVPVVREELARGVIGPRHRVFLTWRDTELVNVVIVTRLPSENAYLLDLEFYPKKMPTGGLEFAIVRILEQLRDEGVAMFSFGASFGVKICDSANTAADVEEGLAELRDAGIFGEGNFQFKNKFRPVNLPIYLCQRADEHRTPVADVILMIANPDVAADAPEMLAEGTPVGPAPEQTSARASASAAARAQVPASAAPAPAAALPAATSSEPRPAAAQPEPSIAASRPAQPTAAEPTAAIASATRPAPPAAAHQAAADPGTRARHLADSGYNPLALPHSAVDIDFVTDSQAELDLPAIAARESALRDRANQAPDALDFPLPAWLPFDVAVPTPSGRAAETLLCRSWPGPRGPVIHNGLFPTLTLTLLDAGFQPVRTPAVAATGHPTAPTPFAGDLDLPALKAALAAGNGGTAFLAVEFGGNAGGGHPISLANLRAVRAAAAVHGVPIVADATRVVENALAVAEHEDAWRGADPWDVVRELLALTDAATLSLSKDFGVTFGGLVAARTPELADRLREHVAMRGREIGLAARRLLAAAIADTAGVLDLATARRNAVAELWHGLADAGVPVLTPAGGHCVVLDVDRMPQFAGAQHPVESCLAWLYQGTGVRGAPHLAGAGPAPHPAPANHASPTQPPAPRHLVRLAVPHGLPPGRAAEAARRVADLWRSDAPVPDLIPVGAPTAGPQPVHARFHPAAGLPEDIEEAMREGHRPQDENAAVLREAAAPAYPVTRHVLPVPGGDVEVFTAGSGPALLLMTPFNIGAGVFARQFAGLADRFQLITVHHPGVGVTTTREDITLDGIAELYDRVLDLLGVTGPVHVSGSSFGGLVAQTFALRHPERTATLTLIGSSYKVGNRNGEVNRLSIVAKEDFDKVIHEGGSTRVAAARAELEPLLLRCESMDPQIGLSYLDVFASQATLLGRLPDIAVPTLIIQGRCDTVIPLKTAHLLHGAIPDAAYEELPDAGHFPCLTHPDEVHALLLPFLAAHPVEAACLS